MPKSAPDAFAAISDLTHYSPIYYTRIFKKEIGRSTTDYLLEKRIDEAKKLLPDETMTVVQIAETVGFSDYNYFTRLFHKRSGCLPHGLSPSRPEENAAILTNSCTDARKSGAKTPKWRKL